MKTKALIIEDDPTMATVFATAMEAADYETEVVQDGQAALERLATSTPHVILLDLHLPKVSGPQIVEQVRSSEHLANTRIVVVSGHDRLADRVRDQVDLVLDKPVSFQQLRLLADRMRPAD